MQDLGAETSVHETDAPDTGGAAVTVRYWAAARAAAGRAEDRVEGVTTVQQALEAARQLHRDNGRFAEVLAISSVLLGDRPVQRDQLDGAALSAGDVVEVLPPFAGG